MGLVSLSPLRPSLKDGRGAWFPHSAPLHLWQTLYMAMHELPHGSPLTQCEHARARGAEREATARGDPPPVRLAGDRAGRADQPSRVGARAPGTSSPRANAGARSSKALALLDSIDNHFGLTSLIISSIERIAALCGVAPTLKHMWTGWVAWISPTA